MEQKYNPQEIEKKWQQYWEEHKTYKTEVDESMPKYYVLDMWPYPSGAGLHVGHVVGYTGTDVIARYKRQKGFNVLHPMGWDSFGLPAEQYAIRTGTHPQITTEKNIKTYKKQLKSLGFSYDWDREIASSDPKYYKWTQWIFTKLYEKGIAYQAEVTVNFCEELGTVLSNEEVENGKSIEGGFQVVQKPLKQWIFKITQYAESLLEGLDDLDWPDHLKKLQRNWIGKSTGMEVSFKVDGADNVISCYTTRQDTMYGVSFVVISPEHPEASSFIQKKYKSTCTEYQKEASLKNDMQRTELAKEKTGVFTGSYVINPLTGKSIPVWMADYVLASYGTGAVMGVPSDDARDKEFAEKYEIEILDVFDEDRNYNSPEDAQVSLKGLSEKNLDEAKKLMEDYLVEQGQGKACVKYKLRDWLFSRQRYWGEPFPIIHQEDGSIRTLELDELPLTPPVMEDFLPSPDGKSPLAKMKNWVEVIDPVTGKKGYRETNTMPQWAGSCWYYLRFCDPSNQEAAWGAREEKYWMPVDLYVGGVEHAVLHLLYSRFWHKVLFDLGLVSTSEPFKSLVNQGLVTSMAYKKDAGGYVSYNDIEEVDGLIRDRHTKAQLHAQIEKMSKSKLNGVSPDEILEEFGADALRLYELFMTPFDKEKIWQSDAVSGCRRFLNRVYDLCQSKKICEEESEDSKRLINRLIKAVDSDLEILSFNTAIAKMMEFVNKFSALSSYPKSSLKTLCQLIYPFAPHFGAECFEILGESENIVFASFPKYDPKYLEDDQITIVFQVMGKLRGSATFKKGASKDEILKKAKEDPRIKKYLSDGVLKEIFVPNKLVNFVVSKK
ncbi:MAG: Leucine--tRNA ligase [Chlamydiia bacterium]|nr:Leucine--tRNA ligase [Chlamydiia bacterium]